MQLSSLETNVLGDLFNSLRLSDIFLLCDYNGHMRDTFVAPPLRQINNPKEFASNHYATLKAAQDHKGAEVPGYVPLPGYTYKLPGSSDTFVKNTGDEGELSLNMTKAGSLSSPGVKGKYLQICARLKSGILNKEMTSVCHVAGQSSVITKIIIPRPWSTQQWEIHQVNLPDNSIIPPTYSKRVGPDFALEESSPGQVGYPRELVWGLFDTAKELEPTLRIPDRTVGALARDFMRALGGVEPPYWDGVPTSS
jgi:hypothetical protein